MGAADCRLKDLAASPGGRRRGDLRSPGVMRAAVAAATGMPAPAGGWSSGMHPPISLLSCQKRNGLYPQGVCRIRKAAEPPTAARLHGPKRKALGAFRFATRCRGGRRSCCINPSLRPSSTTSQRQRKEKQFNATTTPTTSTSSAAGQQSQKSQKMIACPKAGQNRLCTDRARHRGTARRRNGIRCRDGGRRGSRCFPGGVGLRRRRADNRAPAQRCFP